MDALNTLAQNYSKTATDTVLGGDGLVGLALALLCLALSILLTWAVLRAWIIAAGAPVPERAPGDEAGAPQKKPASQVAGPLAPLLGEGYMLLTFGGLLNAMSDTIIAYLRGLAGAAGEVGLRVLTEWPVLIGLGFVIVGSIAWLEYHDLILDVSFESVQCYIRPIVDGFVFPILSALRVVFAAAWPFFNGFADTMAGLTYGNGLVFLTCVDASVLENVVTHLGYALRDLTVSLGTMVANLLNDGRWDMLPGLTEIGEAYNATRPVWDCYCPDAAPILDFVYGVPTSPSLYVAVDCVVNAHVRGWEILFNLIFKGQTLNTTLFAEEATCAIFGYGAWAEDVFALFIEFLVGVVAIIEEIIGSEVSLAERAPLYTRMAVAQTLADADLDLPPVVRTMKATTGAVPLRAYTLSAMSAIDHSIVAAYGPSQGLFTEVDALVGAANNLPSLPNISLIAHLGLEALQRLAATPWSGLFTAAPATIVGVFNLTVNAVCHPFQAFGYQEGIRFFQYGYLGDYTRLFVIAAADLLVFISEALPCTFSKPLQAAVSTGEVLAELATGVGYAARFPPWQMGVPPPVNCSVTNCTQGVTNFSLSESLAAYYNWSTSRLRRNLVLLEEGGECTAYLLGCNTTADNNNSTNTTSNCTDAPLACTARSLNRVVTSTINLTLALALNLPNLLHFNGTQPTFADMPTVATQLALEDFLLCLGLLIDEFDFTGNHCISDVPPGPQPNGSIVFPPDDPIGVFGVPPRTEWECRIDGGAYYWDGRQVIVLNTSNIYDLNTTQYPCLITDSRECIIAAAHSVEVLGSAPEHNVTLLILPDWANATGAQPLILVYNATTGTMVSSVPNASQLADVYNVSNIVETNCTQAPPLTPMLGPQYACDTRLYKAMFLTSVSRDQEEYGVSFVYADGHTLDCDVTLASNYTCGSDGIMYFESPFGQRVVYYQQLTATPLVDWPMECVPSSSPPEATVRLLCQYNTLAVLATNDIPGTFNASDPLYWPVYYYPNSSVSSTRVPLPCENIPPVDYRCEATLANNGVGWMWANGSVLETSFNEFPFENLECQNNTLQDTPPICTRITVSYTTGPDVVVELEGGEVRVYANDTKEAVPCIYQGITNHTAGAASTYGTSGLKASEEGLNLKSLVRQAQAQTAARFATRGTHTSRVQATVLRDPLGRGSLTADRILARSWIARQASHYVGANVTLHRIKSLVCCFSELVTASGDFFVQTFYAVVYLLQGILTLPADPSYEVFLPTFAASRDALRDAFCALGCEIMSFLPFTLSCPNSAGGTCNDLTVCGTNFLCDVGDVLIVGVDFFVNLLTMIRALLLGQQPPPGSNVLGACSYGNPSACLTHFLVVVITAPIQATMQAARTLSGTGDCLLCSLARVVNPESPCVGIFFAIVNTLATVIDTVALTLVSAAVNLGLGLLQFFIYFFAGQFGQAWNAFSTYVLGFIFTLFRNFALLILESAKKLPVIGPIISNILAFFQTSCTVVSDILQWFGGRPIDCISVGVSSKRGLVETQWLALNPNVTLVWPSVGGCAASMAALNATNLYESVDDALAVRELAFCTAAHLWIGPAATPEADPKARPFPQPCDVFMPTVYAQNKALHTLAAEEQTRVLECVDARLRAEYVRADQDYSGQWVPHDIYYPGSGGASAALQLFSDALVAHQVWYFFFYS